MSVDASTPLGITVVTRSCDRPNMLLRASEGLARQKVDFVWLIVNASETPLDEAPLRERVPNMSVLNPKGRLSRGAAGRAGLAQVKTPLALLHDDDDALLPDALDRMQSYLHYHPHDIGVVCGYEVWHEGATSAHVETIVPELPPNLYNMCEHNTMLTISTLFRLSAYEAIGGLRADLDVLEDWDLWLRMLSIGDFGVMPHILAQQYVRPIASGPDANSVHTDHLAQATRLQNAYLREAIKKGSTSLGELTIRPHARFVEESRDRISRASRLTRRLSFWRR